MKLTNIKTMVLAVSLPMAIMLSGTAQAKEFIIDDFYDGPDAANVSYSVTDNTVSDGAESTPGNAMPIVGSNHIMQPTPTTTNNPNNWTRTISAELLTGDSLSTQVCANCEAGHMVAGAGGASGISKWIYEGSTLDLRGYSGLYFEYAADLDGGILQFTFTDNAGDIAVVSTAALQNTNNSSDITNPANRTPVTLALPTFAGIPGGLGYGDIERIEIMLTGVADLDFSIDNVKMVPEPGTLALFGLGLAGLAFRRRNNASTLAA